MPKVNLLAFLDTFYYLRRQRAGELHQGVDRFAAGSQALTELKQGQAFMLERPRGRSAAMERVVDIMRQTCGATPVMVNVMEAGRGG